MGDSTESTILHKNAVVAIGAILTEKLIRRFEEHDNSKLKEPEKSILDKHVKPPGGAQYKSWDATATGEFTVARDIQTFLDHHYRVNDHHPQHFDNGVDGMDLLALMEMFVDWVASSWKTKDGNIYRSIQFGKDQFKMSPQLVNIFMNTAVNLDKEFREMKDGYQE